VFQQRARFQGSSVEAFFDIGRRISVVWSDAMMPGVVVEGLKVGGDLRWLWQTAQLRGQQHGRLELEDVMGGKI